MKVILTLHLLLATLRGNSSLKYLNNECKICCFDQLGSQITVSLFLLAGLVITTPQGTLVPTASTQSFVAGHPTATTMIVSAVHHSNTGKTKVLPMSPPSFQHCQ